MKNRLARIISSDKDMYYVSLVLKNDNGYISISDEVIACIGKGALRQKNIKPVPGDIVYIEFTSEEPHIITEVLERKNILDRPPVANIDRVLLISSINEPDFIRVNFDRYLCILENKNIDVTIIFSKVDIADVTKLEKLKKIYDQAGYKVLLFSKYDENSYKPILKEIEKGITAIAGNSGVGKSTLIKMISTYSKDIRTGEISNKTKRGKQTTRRTTLYKITKEGYIFDTPGFSSINYEFDTQKELENGFREIKINSSSCKFNNCNHINEPDCAIVNLLKSGNIADERYESYKYFLDELIKRQNFIYRKNMDWKSKGYKKISSFSKGRKVKK